MVLPPIIRWKLKHIRFHLALDQYRYFVHTRNIRLILHLLLHPYSSFHHFCNFPAVFCKKIFTMMQIFL